MASFLDAEPQSRFCCQECGKYKGLADPGCSFILWPMQVRGEGRNLKPQKCMHVRLSYRAWPAAPTDFFPISIVQTVTPVSMQTRQLDVITNTKTQDNVTVSVKTAIMYHVDPASVDTFYFKLHNPHQQITAYVDDCIRSQVNLLTCSTSPGPNSAAI